MAKTSLAQDARPTTRERTRELRGIALYEEHADEIRFEDGVWLIPSQHLSGSGCSMAIKDSIGLPART
jgi:hypothetical protein